MFRRIFTLILLAVASFAYSLPENAEFRIAGSTEGYSCKRLYLADDYYRLSLVESEKKGEDFRSVSFVSPYIGFGRLKPRGLFSELMNPCAYGPTSSVFAESGRLAFDKGMTESGKYGLYARPFGNLTFFMLGSREEAGIRGMHLEIEKGMLRGELLYGNSDPAEKEKNSFYTEHIRHWEGCQLNSLMVKLEGETDFFSVSSVTSVSTGKYMESGIYNREYASLYLSDLAEISFLFSFCTEDYLAPGCIIPSSGFRYGISAGLYPFRNLSITGSMDTDSGMPDYKDSLCNDFSVGYSLKAVWEKAGFRLRAAAEKETKTENTGAETEKSTFLSAFSYSGELFYFSFSYKWYFEDSAEVRNTADCSIRFCPGAVRCTLKWKRDIGEKITDTLSQELALGNGDFDINVSHSRKTSDSSIISVSAEISY